MQGSHWELVGESGQTQPPDPQSLLTSIPSSEKQCPEGGGNPLLGEKQNVESGVHLLSTPFCASLSLSGNRATFS